MELPSSLRALTYLSFEEHVLEAWVVIGVAGCPLLIPMSKNKINKNDSMAGKDFNLVDAFIAG